MGRWGWDGGGAGAGGDAAAATVNRTWMMVSGSTVSFMESPKNYQTFIQA